jgi:hypothetical protein
MTFKLSSAVCAVMAIAMGMTVALAAEPKAASAPATPPPKIAPLADKLLTEACGVLGSAKAFTFHAEINFDEVLPSAVKVQFAGAMDFALQRPGELAVDYRSDLGAKKLWYQNGKLTIFDPPHMVFATVTMPPSIDGMLEQAAANNNISIPLSDLAYSDPCQRIRKQVIFGGYVGVNDVNGIACDHLAFSTAEVDLQLWLQHTGRPIPRKIVINYRTEPGSPEYSAVLSQWTFPSNLPAGLFHPELSSKAKRIDFVKIKETKP